MKVRTALLVLLVVLSSSALRAQGTGQQVPSGDITVLRTLTIQLIDWFDSLSQSFDKLAETEDQRKLKISLVSLSKSIYDLESNGRYLVTVLRRKPVVEEAVRKGVDDTRVALADVAKRLKAVGLLLRSQYRAGGAEAERLIAGAVGRRNLWLGDVDSALASHQIPPDLIDAGVAVLSMQSDASMKLLEVIEKLPGPPPH